MIAQQLLQDVANLVNDRIAKVVLNGTYEITDFEVKEVSGTTVGMEYLIPVAEITQLKLIELKDANDTTLTSNTVNVPINVDTLFLQTVEVKEVSG
ncbi:MAG TPA: hypothetical protein VKZ95_04540 [Sphingobacteriaceae bacterium]|nr:hypothetical protein [Sphingobacteriaceae bacterium]